MSLDYPPQVFFFDVFGTVVEWRSCVGRAWSQAAERALSDPSINLSAKVRAKALAMNTQDWLAIAEEWRKSYTQFTRTFVPVNGFITVDEHHYNYIDDLTKNWNLEGLISDTEKWNLTQCWHRLEPWPDSVQGLNLLNRKFRTSTLSNGNASLLEDLRDYGHLPFEDITSAEHFGAYKPSSIVYSRAAAKFGLDPSECALVAAHLHDLQAAKKVGFQTIYIQRPQEEELPSEVVAQAKQEYVDMWIDLDSMGLLEVASNFGIKPDVTY